MENMISLIDVPLVMRYKENGWMKTSPEKIENGRTFMRSVM